MKSHARASARQRASASAAPPACISKPTGVHTRHAPAGAFSLQPLQWHATSLGTSRNTPCTRRSGPAPTNTLNPPGHCGSPPTNARCAELVPLPACCVD
ncbi:MAG: hypothetical protein WDW38_002699 [Sanguina aurantia]